MLTICCTCAFAQLGNGGGQNTDGGSWNTTSVGFLRDHLIYIDISIANFISHSLDSLCVCVGGGGGGGVSYLFYTLLTCIFF